MSTDFPVLFALLRDGSRWQATRSALAPDREGALRLVRVPAPAAGAPVRIPLPAVTRASGIAVDGCGRILFTETDASRLVMVLPDCASRYVLPARPAHTGTLFDSPAGIATHGTMLWVADRGHGRVLVFLLPSLELRRSIEDGLVEPTAVAVDEGGRLYVVDRGVYRVRRFRSDGAPDSLYDAAMAAHPDLTNPVHACLHGHDLLVSDASADQVLVFDADGQRLGLLALPAETPSVRPRAVAVHGDLVCVSDEASGRLLLFDGMTREYLGRAPEFAGPVAAMTFDRQGDLLLKTDGGADYLLFDVAAGCVDTGSLVAGPLDAGVEGDWERVTVDAHVPPGAHVTVQTFTNRAKTPAPTETDWVTLPGLDALVVRDQAPATGAPGERRFLWVRTLVHAPDGRQSPTVRQVRAHTTAASYLDRLPRIYRRDDAPSRFLERLLALGRSEMDDWDAELDGMFRRLDPWRAPADGLGWVSACLAFSPPEGLSVEGWRGLLARVPDLYARRGTVAGLRDCAEIVAGVRPHIFDAHQARRLWVLGEASRVGVDTALASAAADGLVVPGHVVTDPAYRGLFGEYYAGLEFDRAVDQRIDRTIDFHAGRSVVPIEAGAALDRYSVRWSGQIRPRYSEIYTFYVTPRDGVRLWVDGLLLVDTWTAASPEGAGPRIALDANRWSSITCELHRVDPAHHPEAALEWASRSQAREIVPAECLYSVLDDRADLHSSNQNALDVGSAVVGASGPASASEYGAMLFSEYAHLFTVVAPAASCAKGPRRQALARILDVEKPAHTDYHLCFAEPRMRVGFQARLGIDAIVAEGPPPMRLDETVLGRDTFLGDAPPGGGRVSARARLGHDTVIG